MKILIITKTEELKNSIIRYLDDNVKSDCKMSKKNTDICFSMYTRANNEYTVMKNPTDKALSGISVNLIYLEETFQLACLEKFMPLVDYNLLHIRLVNKPENIAIRFEDRIWKD
jgi:hypothetical protein